MEFLQSILEFFGEYWTALQQGQLPPLGYWNYLILMVFVIIQGPFVTLLSGAGVAAGLFNPFLAVATSVVGSLLADIFWYNVGLLGKFGKYFTNRSGKRKKLVELLQKAMQKHYLKVLLFGKLSLGLAIPAVISAGLCRIKWRSWFPIVFVGEIIFTAMLVSLGYFATESILHVDKIVKGVGISITVICLILLSVVLPVEMRKMIAKESEGSE